MRCGGGREQDFCVIIQCPSWCFCVFVCVSQRKHATSLSLSLLSLALTVLHVYRIYYGAFQLINNFIRQFIEVNDVCRVSHRLCSAFYTFLRFFSSENQPPQNNDFVDGVF